MYHTILQTRPEFEVVIKPEKKMGLGIARCQKGTTLSEALNGGMLQYCMWWDNYSLINEFTTNESSHYGHVDLRDLHKGDCVGL